MNKKKRKPKVHSATVFAMLKDNEIESLKDKSKTILSYTEEDMYELRSTVESITERVKLSQSSDSLFSVHYLDLNNAVKECITPGRSAKDIHERFYKIKSRTPTYNKVYKLIYEESLENMPLYLNKIPFLKAIVKWRLSIRK